MCFSLVLRQTPSCILSLISAFRQRRHPSSIFFFAPPPRLHLLLSSPHAFRFMAKPPHPPVIEGVFVCVRLCVRVCVYLEGRGRGVGYGGVGGECDGRSTWGSPPPVFFPHPAASVCVTQMAMTDWERRAWKCCSLPHERKCLCTVSLD